MFLSTRWGKPSYEIESLPIGEFNKQKLFWEHCSWGGIDDIMALHHSFYVKAKTGKKDVTVSVVNRMALFSSTVRVVVVESTKQIRNAFMGIASAMRAGRNDKSN
jgi:hypothetical protein